MPKDFAQNLRFRKELRKMGARDKGLASLIGTACRRDVLFFVNCFIHVFDARGLYRLPAIPKHVPFVTFPAQDKLLLQIDRAIYDPKIDKVAIPKSREMAASYICLISELHRFLFYDVHAMGMLSRSAAYVENPHDPKALFWKFDHMIEYLPAFLTPIITTAQFSRTNEDNGSVLTGESTTGNCYRGARLAILLLDELAAFDLKDGFKAMAALKSAASCVLFPSTPQGMGNAFYDVCHSKAAKKRSKIIVFNLRWWDTPFKAAGLYTSTDGHLQLLDDDYWSKHDVAGYDFILDGDRRSPWYDEDTADDPDSIRRQEVNGEFLGSGDSFFQPAELAKIERDHCEEPYLVGELDFDRDTGILMGFTARASGRLKLWRQLPRDGQFPAPGNFVVGGDIARGTKASNTCLVVTDQLTGEQVAEFVDCECTPDENADYAVALCRFFCSAEKVPAFLIWELQGPGQAFGSRVLKTGFRNVYYPSAEDLVSKARKQPGWPATSDSVSLMLTNFARAIKSGSFIVRSRDLIDECRHYQFMPGGKIAHVGSVTAIDPSGAQANHGDRVVAGGVCFIGMQGFTARAVKPKQIVPPNSPAGRRKQRLAKLEESPYAWT